MMLRLIMEIARYAGKRTVLLPTNIGITRGTQSVCDTSGC